jgi:protein tyrosine phosphatase
MIDLLSPRNANTSTREKRARKQRTRTRTDTRTSCLVSLRSGEGVLTFVERANIGKKVRPFVNFFSVDHTRVILQGDGSPGCDYINANRINGEELPAPGTQRKSHKMELILEIMFK